MAKRTGGLGKGLSALIPIKAINTKQAREPISKEEHPIEEGTPKEIPLEDIRVNPHQPRTSFDDEALIELSKSVKQYGVLQPVLVRKTTKGYELIAGERRFRAAKLAGLKTIPGIFREYNDMQMTEVALIENIQRENLNPIEEAQAYANLLEDYGFTQEVISNKIGRSRSHIANIMRLLKLSPKVQQYLVTMQISMGQAKPLLALEDFSLQEKAADFIINNDLSARKCEALIKQLQNNPHLLDEVEKDTASSSYELSENEVFIIEVQDKLKLALGTNVHIKNKGKKKRIEIDFSDDEELNRVLEFLLKEKQEASKEDKLKALRKFSTSNFNV